MNVIDIYALLLFIIIANKKIRKMEFWIGNYEWVYLHELSSSYFLIANYSFHLTL